MISEREECSRRGPWSKTLRHGLTPRQWEVARLVRDGLANREIADRLVLSEKTVAKSVLRIRERLGVRNRVQIAVWIERRDPG